MPEPVPASLRHSLSRSGLWDSACSIHEAKDAAKYKDYILPLIFTKRLELEGVEADIIRKFAEGSDQSAGEFYTPPEVGPIMSRVLAPESGMTVYDPTCGSGGRLVKLETAREEKERGFSNPQKEGGHSCPPFSAKHGGKNAPAPLKLFGQEYVPETWAMANMNMIIHDMEGQIEIGDTFKNPKFRDKSGKICPFDRAIFPDPPRMHNLLELHI